MSQQNGEQKAETSKPQLPNIETAPKRIEKITIKQIEAMKEHRRRGMDIEAIAKIMGVSAFAVSKYTRGVSVGSKPQPNNGGDPQQAPTVIDLAQPTGTSRPISGIGQVIGKIRIPLEIEGQYLLMMAGDATRLGYSNMDDYMKDTINWLGGLQDIRRITGANSPEDLMDKLVKIMKKAQQWELAVEQAEKRGRTRNGSSD